MPVSKSVAFTCSTLVPAKFHQQQQHHHYHHHPRQVSAPPSFQIKNRNARKERNANNYNLALANGYSNESHLMCRRVFQTTLYVQKLLYGKAHTQNSTHFDETETNRNLVCITDRCIFCNGSQVIVTRKFRCMIVNVPNGDVHIANCCIKTVACLQIKRGKLFCFGLFFVVFKCVCFAVKGNVYVFSLGTQG